MNQAFKEAVFEQLAANSAINQDVIDRARSVNNQSNADNGELRALLDSGLIPENIVANSVCEAGQLELISASEFPTQAVENTAPLSRFLRENEALPIALSDGELELAMTDPSNAFIIKILQAKLNCTVTTKVAVRSELLSQLNRLYATQHSNQSTAADLQDDQSSDTTNSDSPIVREVHRLLLSAASKRASDVHFEPSENGLQVRYRVNGLLQHSHNFNSTDAPRVVARIKLMARLDVTEKRLPQNGRFRLPAEGRILDFRVSTLPLHNGESLVLRLLEGRLSGSSLNELGFTANIEEQLNAVIDSQQGLLLVTGPTGSGKTTTLYSLLNSINKPELKIISIEDPVEINLENINQIQINEEHGITFAQSLRSVLRQDPDVIMVGEIRDAETAQLACQAALTGHLVLSTLHTNSAISTLSRLRNLGLADYLIDSALKGVLAQRLLRTICPNCNSTVHQNTRHLNDTNDTNNGYCSNCDGSGFAGRTTVAEYLPFREYHTLHTPTNELCNQLLDQKTMQLEARRLVRDGKTTEKEVIRIMGNSL